MKTPAQKRANRYAMFRLVMLGFYLGAVFVEPTLTALTSWAVTAGIVWPWRPDWRL